MELFSKSTRYLKLSKENDMSRSYRKTPICGYTCAESEKQDKRVANRKFRRESRVAIRKGKEPPISLKQISNVWDFAKDGKQYLRKATLAKFPDLMRK